jgi:CheY-like chemotaxis protein
MIAFTAYAMGGDREKFLVPGKDDYPSTPVDEEKLLEKINAKIGLKHEDLS